MFITSFNWTFDTVAHFWHDPKWGEKICRSVHSAHFYCTVHIYGALICWSQNVQFALSNQHQVSLKIQRAMQVKKGLTDNCLRVSKVSSKFRIPTIYNFAVIYPWNVLFSSKVTYFLTVSIIFSVYKQNLMAQ